MLRRLAKDPDSREKYCPSVYVDDDGTFVVQGHVLDDAAFNQLENVLPNESAVRINPSIILEAIKKHQS